MKFSQSTLILSLLASIRITTAAALPSTINTLVKRSRFTQTCEILNFNVPFLSTSCVGDDGKRDTQEFNLDDCFGNENGIITRRSRNLHFSATCQNFITNGATFTAECRDKTGNLIIQSVDTNEFLSNDNGKIKCDRG